jgi:hypothetical protein
MDQPNAPILLKPIPPQIVNEGASFGPLNLNDFIGLPDMASGQLRFQAELADGASLPKGLMCTQDGMIGGIPAARTAGSYDLVVTASHDSATPFAAQFALTIKASLVTESTDIFGNFKTQVWEALMKNLPVPDVGDILNRPISAVELFYLLQRFAVLTIWDVYNLEMPADKKILTLEGMSPHYHIYDRGSCLVGAPKDLFSHERTLEDALQTARVMSREVYKRNWTIELSGFNKMIRASWVELQLLGDKNGRHLDILRYDPTSDDMRIYTEKAKTLGASGMGL